MPAGRPKVPSQEGDTGMVLLGVDPHRDTHTVVAVDQAGRQLGQTTVAARTVGHAELLGWNTTCWPPGSGWCESHHG
jgi:transposase